MFRYAPGHFTKKDRVKVVPYSVWRSKFVLAILAVWQIGGHDDFLVNRANSQGASAASVKHK